MIYFIRNLKTGFDRKISEDEFNQSKKINQRLIEVLLIEEKFDILLCNYFELEQALLDISLKERIFNYEENHDNYFVELNTIDRKVFNLLASCRMYTDQMSYSFSKIYGRKSEQYKEWKNIQSQQLNNNLAYLLMYKIRNHIQHHSLLVTQINKMSNHLESNRFSSVENKLEIKVNIEELKNNKGFERDEKNIKTVLPELEELEGKYFNLVQYIRDYLSSIGLIHGKIRGIINQNLTEWDNFFDKLLYPDEKDNKNEMFSIIVFDIDCSEILEKIDLVYSLVIDRRKRLEKKNNFLKIQSNFNNYITNKI